MSARWHDLAGLSALVAPSLADAPLGLLLRAFEALVEPGGRIVASGLAHGPIESWLRRRHGETCMRFLPSLDDRVSAYGPWQLRSDVTQDAQAVLSDVDLDWHRHAGIGHWLQGSARRAHLRQRRIDTLFAADCARIADRIRAIVVIEDLGRVRAVLAGAQELLRSHATPPVLLLPLAAGAASVADRTALMTQLAAAGYRLLDATLALHAPDEVDDELIALRGEWMLGLPWPRAGQVLVERLLGLTPQEALPLLAQPAGEAWNRAVALAWARELRTGGLRLVDYDGAGRLTLAVNGEVVSWGFHAPEGPLGEGWRWIGPRPRAGLVVPATDRPVDHIELIAPSAHGDTNRHQMAASLDGEPAHVEMDWSGGYGRIRITPRRPGRQFRAMHLIELHCPEARRASAEDERLLAMSLSRLTVVGCGA